jgi:hypothetical protein
MFGWPLRHAVVVAAGGALALSGSVQSVQSVQSASAPHPSNATTSWWRITSTFGVTKGQGALTSISAPSAVDAWATGFTVLPTDFGVSAFIRHWTGKTWRAVSLPPRLARAWSAGSPILAQIGSSSAANVWLFNGIGSGRAQYLRLKGTRWSMGTLPGAGGSGGEAVLITSAKVFSPTDVWAFGVTLRFGPRGITSPYAAHFDGRRWSTVPVPGMGAITAVSAVSPKDLWAVVGSITTQRIAPAATPAVLQWTARLGWRAAPVQPKLPGGAQLSSVLAARGGRLWIGGEAPNPADGLTPLVATWTGSAWTTTELPITASTSRWGMAELAANGTGLWGVAAAEGVAGHELWHLNGTKWSKVSPGFGWHVWQLAQLVGVPGTRSLWAAGAIRYNGTVKAIIALDGPTASVQTVGHQKKTSHLRTTK